jgi:tRNA (guanine37-N1)-methyltransferase
VDGRKFAQTIPLQAWKEPFPTFVPPKTARSIRLERRKRKGELGGAGVEPKSDPGLEGSLEQLELSPEQSAPKEPSTGRDSPSASTSTATVSGLTPRLPAHYIMNLPDSALTFLDAFASSYVPLLSEPSFISQYPDTQSEVRGTAAEIDVTSGPEHGSADDKRFSAVPMPMVHVYCFTRELEYPGAEVDICQVSAR